MERQRRQAQRNPQLPALSAPIRPIPYRGIGKKFYFFFSFPPVTTVLRLFMSQWDAFGTLCME
jgi:hypothetical protein